MPASTSRDSDKFMLRLPDGMRKRIERSAKSHGRSMNSEIVATLEEHYPSDVNLDELINQTNALAKAQARAHREGMRAYQLEALIESLREIVVGLASEDGRTRK